MAVVLARVDNRLVHGQILESWVPAMGVDAILVVDPALGENRLQKMVLEGLSRRELKIQLVTPRVAAALLEGVLRETRVMVLFKGLSQALAARDAGVSFEKLNLGNIHPGQDSRSLTMSSLWRCTWPRCPTNSVTVQSSQHGTAGSRPLRAAATTSAESDRMWSR